MKIYFGLVPLILSLMFPLRPLAQSQADVQTLKLSTTVIGVPVVVHDPSGKVVHGLTAADFSIRQDGQKQTIRYFSEDDNLPLSLALMIDLSGSTSRLQLNEIAASRLFFTTTLSSPADRAALVRFDSNIVQVHSMTHDASALNSALQRLTEHHAARTDLASNGQQGTLLYDGLCAVSESVLGAPANQPRNTRKAIVVLTDGVDYHSKLSIGQAIDCAQRSNASIYSVLFSEYPLGSDNLGQGVLQTLSDATGGSAFVAGPQNSLNSIFQQIQDDLHAQYLLGYNPPASAGGKYHRIEVKALRARLQIQVRAGYYAGSEDGLPASVSESHTALPTRAISSGADNEVNLSPAASSSPSQVISAQTLAAPAQVGINAGKVNTTIPVGAGSASAYSYWPNAVSHTNSDLWLREHHDEIAVLNPRVLVLIADNQISVETVQRFLKTVVAAVAEASRYHGYDDKSSKPQLIYQISYIVDLRDKAKTPWPASWPMGLDSSGKLTFVYAGLFTPSFSRAMGIRDPGDADKFLSIRELFEDGLINEVWMVYPENLSNNQGLAGIFETAAHAQIYDQGGKKKLGEFDDCWGLGCDQKTELADASVTMRFTELNTSRGVGCFLHAVDHEWEAALARDIPAFDEVSARFFYQHLKREGLPMDSLYDGCTSSDSGASGHCYEYPNDHSIARGKLAVLLPPFRWDQWGQGCGTAHMPPNGRFDYDYSNTKAVLSTCEDYGMLNGAGGRDLEKLYSPKTYVKGYDQRYADCGGGWQVYLRQSFPGYKSSAKNVDGTPMKAWWPYFYY